MGRLLAIVDAGAPLPEGVRAVRLGRLDLVVAPGAVEPPSAAALRAHDARVREIAARAPALLPAAFGVAVAGDGELRAAIAPRADDLAAALELVRGREQMTVRVLGDAVPPRTGTEYLRSRARVPGAEVLRALAGPLVAAERVRPGGAPPVIGSVYHLVPRGSAGEYSARLRPEPRFRVRGPFPPYAFTGVEP